VEVKLSAEAGDNLQPAGKTNETEENLAIVAKGLKGKRSVSDIRSEHKIRQAM